MNGLAKLSKCTSKLKKRYLFYIAANQVYSRFFIINDNTTHSRGSINLFYCTGRIMVAGIYFQV